MLMDKFDEAVQRGNSEEIISNFRLFPLLGQVDLGLDKFSAYICGMISRHCQEGMRAMTESANKKTMHLDLMTRLFEIIALMVDRQSALVETHYGPGKMLHVILRLQREADIQTSIILGGLMETRQLQRKLIVCVQMFALVFEKIKEIKQYEAMSRNKAAGSNSTSQDLPVDPRELDDEVAALRAAASSDEELARLPAEGSDGLAKTSKLNEQVQTLIGFFISIEDYFIARSIEKALKIDQLEPSMLVSSCVSDVFYVLKTGMQRGISTGDPDCLCALINSISRLLEVDFMNVLQRKLSQSFGSNTDSSKDMQSSFMTLLNNISVSCEYTIKLAQEVESEFPRSFSHISDLSREKIKSCLGTLTDHTVKFQNILR
eukprot:jgi/Hompol1/5620/HPOL_004593-RA